MRKIENVINLLFSEMKMVEPYPDGIKPVDKMLDITAFFPGGRGVWLEESSDKLPTVMVIGNEFSTYKKYCEMKENATNDLNSPTWSNLTKLFEKGNIDLNSCFFTNAFMGLKNEKSMIAKTKGFENTDFIKRNLEFLVFQIETIKPTLIITLGKVAADMLAKLSPSDLNSWENGKALSIPNVGLKRNVKINKKFYICVALEHPSMRNSNIKRRDYTDLNNNHFEGDNAEVNMLIDSQKGH